MIEFEEIADNITEAPKKVGKLLKNNKVFAIALGGVAVAGLYALYKKKGTSEAVETYAYVPSGYDGYPEMSESTYDDVYSLYDSLYSMVDSSNTSNQQITSDVSQMITDMQIENDRYIAEIVDTFNSEREKYDETLSYLEEKQYKESVIQQMQNNSTLWSLTDSAEQKQQLHDKNMELGTSLGATYDSASGTWWLNGERLYTSVVETAKNTNPQSTQDSTNVGYSANVDYQGEIIKAIETGAGASVINSLNEQRNAKIEATGGTSTVTYDKNTDYAALIQKAQEQGASQQVIDNLTAQREAKIAGENLNNDGTKKTTSSGTTSTGKIGGSDGVVGNAGKATYKGYYG